MIVPPTPMVDKTISGEIVLGNIWTNISFVFGQFVALAASTYSAGAGLKTARESGGVHWNAAIPNAIIVLTNPSQAPLK